MCMERNVVAPDTLIRFKLGKIWVHTCSNRAHACFADVSVLSLLSEFATPRTVNEAVANCGLSGTQAMIFINELRRIGALLPEDSRANEVCYSSDRQAERQAELAGIHISSLANAAHQIAGDLMAFGPAIHPPVAEESGVSILARLEALIAAMDALKSELQERRGAFLSRQMQQLALRDTGRLLKLNIGAGKHTLDSWVNIDVFPAEFAMDVRWGFPFADGSAEYVFLSHTLEHLYYPDEALSFLKEVRRVLSPSGRVRIVVPDVEKCIQAYVQKDEDFYASRRKTWTWWPSAETRLEGFLAYAGAGPSPDSFFDSHKFGYDFETLTLLLERSGFGTLERSEYMASSDPVLRIDNASLVAGAMYRDKYYSLFVEATP